MLLLFALWSSALARVDFGVHPFDASEFRSLDKVSESCSAPAASAFFCGLLDAELTRIPTKGVDFFFDEAGELVAAFAKQQKGQNLKNYNLDAGQNLVPFDAAVPGAAVLVDGEYHAPEEVSGSWERLSANELRGTFDYRVDGVAVRKAIVVSNVSHTFDVLLEATPVGEGGAEGEAAGGGDPKLVQLAFTGIGRATSPVVKVGTADTFSKNPLPQPVLDPAYVSLQTTEPGTFRSGNAFVMVPDADAAAAAGSRVAAQALAGGGVALQTEVAPGEEAVLAAEVYAGPNELVRYDQEGYLGLPGLFAPNLLGRLSLGILWVLRTIHDYVGSWGLSIIVLTLLFRAAIWPLITTQTKSMYGMQQLQPKIQAMQKKYKDDREKLTQETMKLYKEAGVNPAGGCLPILLQMPLFIILWRVFVNFEFAEGFLWIPDLGQADPFYILPALYVLVMLGQSWFSAKGNPQSLRQQVIINLVFAFIIINFPAGVILYFVVSMGVQIFQYWLISREQGTPATAK